MKKRVLSILLALAMICVLVPTTVFAADDMSDEFKSILNADGKLEMDYINPNECNNFVGMLNCICDEFSDSHRDWETGIYLNLQLNDDFSTGTITMYQMAFDENGYQNDIELESHTVELVWAECDPVVMDLVNEKMSTFPADKDYFEVTFLEYLNALYNSESEDEVPLANYSSELKAFFDNKFSFSLREGMGDGYLYFTEVSGDLKVMYDGVAYYVWPEPMTARLDWALYIPEDTADTVEGWTAAAQKVLDDYFGEGVAKITHNEYDPTFEQYYNEYKEYMVNGNAEEAERAFGEGGELEFATHAVAPEDGSIGFGITAGNLNASCVVIEDDSKFQSAPVCETVDLKTEVKVETTDISVPLDTKVTVEMLTESEELNKVVTALEKVEEIANVETSVSYDISLFSETLNDNITKLENGTFKVSLPIPDELEGKDLAVYYVDDDGKAIPHDVVPVEGYAVFETNHFSTYTLVEIKKADSGAGTQGEAVPQPEEKPVEDKDVIANTADATQVMPWMVTMMFATVGCGVVASKRKEIE